MDSVTQAALGAVVGSVVAGRTLGRRAVIVGAIAGTMPDLDIVISPFVDDTMRLILHRGITHSLVLAPLFAFAFAWCMPRLIARYSARYSLGLSGSLSGGLQSGLRGMDTRRWFALFFWCFVTHIVLDWCTVFGTKLALPFSDEPYAAAIIFIIDLFYSLPLLVCVVWILARKRPHRVHRRIAVGGLTISSAYLILAVLLKSVAVAETNAALSVRAESEFITQQITFNAPLSIILWQTLAMVDDGHWTADYAVFGCGLTLHKVPAHAHRGAFIAAAQHNEGIGRLLTFSRGFFRLIDIGDDIVFRDLRFGDNPHHPFSFRVGTAVDGAFVALEAPAKIEPPDIENRLSPREFRRLWRRMFKCDPPPQA